MSRSAFTNNTGTVNFGLAIEGACSVVVSDCTFAFGKGPDGGALQVDKPSAGECDSSGNGQGRGGLAYALVTGCSFVRNRNTDSAGSALMVGQGGTRVEHCLFDGNEGIIGAAIYATQASGILDIYNCSFTNNRADYAGGAILYTTSSLDQLMYAEYATSQI